MSHFTDENAKAHRADRTGWDQVCRWGLSDPRPSSSKLQLGGPEWGWRSLFSFSPSLLECVAVLDRETSSPECPFPRPLARERHRGSQRWGGDTDSKRTAAFYRSIDSCSRRPADGRMWPEIRQPGGRGGPLYLAPRVRPSGSARRGSALAQPAPQASGAHPLHPSL